MVRLGIIGIGVIAKDYIDLILSGCIPEVSITALCSRSREKMEQVLKNYGLTVAAYQDYEQMLCSGLIDAVLICTPHGQHPVMTRQALEAGLHVLVEKPVGIFAEEVEACLDVLKEKPELICGVMYNRRASRAFQYAKKIVSSGEIGELVRCTWVITNLYRTNAYYATSPWRGSWETEGGGILMTQASHQLDLMQWICGMPSSILARCRTVNRPIQVENEAELFMTYPNGAHGHFIASAHECPGRNFFEICGTKGSVSIRDDSYMEIVRLEQDERGFAAACPFPFEKVPCKMEKVCFHDSDNKGQQAATIQNFALAIQKKAPVQCSLAEGLRSLQIIHGAYASSRLQSNVSLPVCSP